MGLKEEQDLKYSTHRWITVRSWTLLQTVGLYHVHCFRISRNYVIFVNLRTWQANSWPENLQNWVLLGNNYMMHVLVQGNTGGWENDRVA